MTKKELLPLAKIYFDSDKLRIEIFGTEDKHFFNTENDVKSYCKVDKQYYRFTLEDFDANKTEEKEKAESEKAKALFKEKEDLDEEKKIAEEIRKEEKSIKQNKKHK